MKIPTSEESERKRRAEEREVRRIIERDYSASLMNNTKWHEVIALLNNLPRQTDLPLRIHVKFVDVDKALEGKPFSVTDRYFDSPWGPVLILSIEWLEINPVAVLPRGFLLEPQRVDHSEEILKGLERIGASFTKLEDGSIRVIGHVRRSDPPTSSA
ncbi:MAG: hypothetical protein KY468_13330 [Armatimonadetes bacterium]|nr:hypothetical protein [Armatimonadota bacterium]